MNREMYKDIYDSIIGYLNSHGIVSGANPNSGWISATRMDLIDGIFKKCSHGIAIVDGTTKDFVVVHRYYSYANSEIIYKADLNEPNLLSDMVAAINHGKP